MGNGILPTCLSLAGLRMKTRAVWLAAPPSTWLIGCGSDQRMTLPTAHADMDACQRVAFSRCHTCRQLHLIHIPTRPLDPLFAAMHALHHLLPAGRMSVSLRWTLPPPPPPYHIVFAASAFSPLQPHLPHPPPNLLPSISTKENVRPGGTLTFRTVPTAASLVFSYHSAFTTAGFVRRNLTLCTINADCTANEAFAGGRRSRPRDGMENACS